MTIATSRGFCVVTDDGIDMRTVSHTRRAALVNWLVAAKDQFVFKSHTDEDIEGIWLKAKGDAKLVDVSVQAILYDVG